MKVVDLYFSVVLYFKTFIQIQDSQNIEIQQRSNNFSDINFRNTTK